MEPFCLRDASPQDQRWLAALYADVRRAEFAPFGWNEATADAFLLQQFELQQRNYKADHPFARCQVIESRHAANNAGAGARIGRLWVDRADDAFRVLDISLLSAWRGRGIGRSCLQALLDEASACGRSVQLHVADGNPARRLYERLGFAVVDHCPPYATMRWRPAGVVSSLHAEVCDEQA